MSDQHADHQCADITFDAGQFKYLGAAQRECETEERQEFAMTAFFKQSKKDMTKRNQQKER